VAVEFAVDLFCGPGDCVFVLDPFEVGDGDAAGVCEDCGDDFDTLFVEFAFAGGVAWCVCGFCHDFAVEPACFFFFDHLFECAGDEDIDGCAVEIFFADFIRIALEAADASGFHVVFVECFAVDAFVVSEGTGVVHDGDDGCAHVLEDLAGPAVDITEAEEGDFHAFDGDADSWEHFCECVCDALSCCFESSFGAAEFDGFSGDDAECVVVLM